MKKKFLYILPIMLAMSFLGHAQQEKVVNRQDQVWWSVNSLTRISERFGVVGDFHVRRNEFLRQDNFYFARIGTAYWVSDELTLVGGYAHLWLSTTSENGKKVFQDENRVYQQIQWRQKVGRATFIQRIRNEQRWHEVLDENGDFLRTRFSNRIRFLSSFSFDIFNDPSRPSLVISDEILVHFGKDVLYNTFDQNRVFAGLKVPVTRDLKFDIGYMMVFQQHYTGMSYDMNHTFRFFFYYSPDLRKEKDRLHYSLPGDE